MEKYKNILLAFDLNPKDDNQVSERALAFMRENKARLSLVHVVEPVTNYGMSAQRLLDCIEEHEAEAKEKVNNLAKDLEIPEDRQFVKVGAIAEIIVEVAKNIKADLIVMGNHGRHGIKSLFMQDTAASLIKHVDCDVLAIKV
ncbi:MAG: universal stress protein [Oligoflexales bacterium]